MKKIGIALLVCLLFVPSPARAEHKIRVVATTTTLASLVREIAGDKADVHAIASPNRDIHFYSPTPKDVLKVRKADVLVHSGLDFETAWRLPLVNAAANPRFLGNEEAVIDASRSVKLLEIPSTVVTRVEGDIHLFGNPHYWVDPENAAMMARSIADGLAALYPAEAEYFRGRAADFESRLRAKARDWAARLAPYAGRPVVAYHNSWVYLTERFKIKTLGFVEPKPGIPPTAKHIQQLIALMKQNGCKIIVKDSFQENRTPRRLAEATGGNVVTLSQSVGEPKQASDYLALMEHNVNELEKKFGGAS